MKENVNPEQLVDMILTNNWYMILVFLIAFVFALIRDRSENIVRYCGFSQAEKRRRHKNIASVFNFLTVISACLGLFMLICNLLDLLVKLKNTLL